MKPLIALSILALGIAAPIVASAQGGTGLNLILNNASLEVAPNGTIDLTGYIQNTNSYAEKVDTELLVGPLDPNNSYANTSNATFTDELSAAVPITVGPHSQTGNMTIVEIQMGNVPVGAQAFGTESIAASSTGDFSTQNFLVTAAVPEFSTMAMLIMGSSGALLQGIRRARKAA